MVNARFVKPLDYDVLSKISKRAKIIVTVEENSLRGGFGQAIADYLLTGEYKGKFKALGIPDRFITHGNRDLLLDEVNLDASGIANDIIDLLSDTQKQNSLLRKLFKKNGKKNSSNNEEELVASEKKKTG